MIPPLTKRMKTKLSIAWGYGGHEEESSEDFLSNSMRNCCLEKKNNTDTCKNKCQNGSKNGENGENGNKSWSGNGSKE